MARGFGQPAADRKAVDRTGQYRAHEQRAQRIEHFRVQGLGDSARRIRAKFQLALRQACARKTGLCF